MIETDRLLLRPHVAGDFNACFAMWQEPEVVRYITGKPATEDEAWFTFLRNVGGWEVLGYGIFAMIEKETGRFVGQIGFSDFRRGLGPDFDPFHEAAWILAGAGQNKGYASEAGHAVHSWLDGKFHPDKTVCIISPDNLASVQLATKLGYKPVGDAMYKEDVVSKFERLCQA